MSISNDNAATTITTTEEWKGTEKIAAGPIGQFYRIYCCCDQPDEYSITEKRLTIVTKTGHCCFQNEEEDNTLRSNIIDVDVSKVAPGWQIFCCGTTTETVSVTTTKGSTGENKILKLNNGQGKVVKQILLRE